jgi:cation:H+ antiporter
MYLFFSQLIDSQSGLLLAFIATAAVVVLSGIRLSLYGDALADRTGIGSGLIGLVFLAAVTSLPELVVSLTSVIQCSDPAQGADLATGNMLGSNVFNLLILALIALLFSKKFIPGKLESPHTDSTLYGLVLLGIFSIAFWIAGITHAVIPALICGPVVLLLPIAYGFILRREHRQQTETVEAEHLPSETLLAQTPALNFYSVLSALCLLIIGGGVILSILGSRMALPPEQGGFGLEASLIGTVFLAISTSLPELVISIASVRMGFLDMAVGNVLGSNMFNLLIIFAADVALRSGNLLSYASPKNWTSVGLIFILTLFAGLLLRTRKPWHTTITAAAMVAIYAASMLFFM